MVEYLIVKKHIDEMDYFSLLSVGAPSDESDTESWKISDKISDTQTEQDIAQVIAEVFNRSFQCNDAASKFADCVRKIYTDLHCQENAVGEGSAEKGGIL